MLLNVYVYAFMIGSLKIKEIGFMIGDWVIMLTAMTILQVIRLLGRKHFIIPLCG